MLFDDKPCFSDIYMDYFCSYVENAVHFLLLASFILHAYIACSTSSESEEEPEMTDTKQDQDVKTKKNVNEFVDDGDDRYILHVAVYPQI